MLGISHNMKRGCEVYEALASLGLAAKSTSEVCYFRLEPSDWCTLKPQLLSVKFLTLRRLRQEKQEFKAGLANSRNPASK